MRILVINPNTTASMTRKIEAAARAVAAAGTEVIAVNPSDGPPSIEGYFDEVFSIPGLIGEMRKAPDMDAYVIACFDDTGLDAARCFTTAPVIGIGEAAFHVASLVAGKFSVITTLGRSAACAASGVSSSAQQIAGRRKDMVDPPLSIGAGASPARNVRGGIGVSGTRNRTWRVTSCNRWIF